MISFPDTNIRRDKLLREILKDNPERTTRCEYEGVRAGILIHESTDRERTAELEVCITAVQQALL